MGEKEWYFFSLRDRKYPTGLRTNRATEAGYWKTTGKDKEIYRGGVLIGMKKTLVFYRGRAPKGEKTNWVMHEYRLDNKLSFKPTKEEWVVCRVFQKSVAIKKAEPTSPSQVVSEESRDETNTSTNEFGDIELLPNLNTLTSPPNLGFTTYPSSLQTYPNNNNNLNIINETSSNWAREMSNLPPLLSWPSSFLTPNLKTTVNSLLVKALQFRNNATTTTTTNNNNNTPSSSYYYHQPRDNNQDTTDYYSFLGNNHQGYGFPSSSAEKILLQSMAVPQPNQPHQQQPSQEQPFNLDSIW